MNNRLNKLLIAVGAVLISISLLSAGKDVGRALPCCVQRQVARCRRDPEVKLAQPDRRSKAPVSADPAAINHEYRRAGRGAGWECP
jgi:hypothetical protein